MLGNIGQLVIAGQVKNEGKVEVFSHMLDDSSTTHTEYSLVHTHTEEITATVLENWGLDTLIVEALRYSRDVKAAPEEIKKHAAALHALFYVIPSTKAIVDRDHIDYVCDMLTYYGHDKDVFLSSLEKMEMLLK